MQVVVQAGVYHDPNGTREMLLCMMLFLMHYLQIRSRAENLAGELGNSGQEQAYQPLRADCCSPRWSSQRCQELRHVLRVSSNQFESFHNKNRFQLRDFDHVGTIFVGFGIPWRKLLGQLADPNVEEHGTGLTPVRAALIPVAKASSAHDEAPLDGVFV